MEEDIERIIGWLHANSLELNSDKTECLIIGSSTIVKRMGQVTVQVDGVSVSSKDSLRLLGMYLDSNLNFRNHVSRVTRTCYAQLVPLFTLRPLVSRDNMITLIRSLIFPHINYMSCIWGSTNKYVTKSVEKVIKSCARLVLSKSRCDPITNSLSVELKWMGPNQMFVKSLLCIMYKIVHDSCSPSYFKELFKTNFDVHGRGTRGASLLQCRFGPSSEAGKRTIEFSGCQHWNSVPLFHNKSYDCYKKDVNKLVLSTVVRV